MKFLPTYLLLMIFKVRNKLCRFRILTVLRTLMPNPKCDLMFSGLRRAVWSHTDLGPSGPTQIRLVPHRPVWSLTDPGPSGPSQTRLVPHIPIWSHIDLGPSGPSQTRLVPHIPVWSQTRDWSGPTQTLLVPHRPVWSHTDLCGTAATQQQH